MKNMDINYVLHLFFLQILYEIFLGPTNIQRVKLEARVGLVVDCPV
jgi:hypothetical protein